MLYRWGEGKDAAAGRSYTLGPEMGDTAAEYAQRWWYVCKRTGGVGGNLDLRGRWLWKTLRFCVVRCVCPIEATHFFLVMVQLSLLCFTVWKKNACTVVVERAGRAPGEFGVLC